MIKLLLADDSTTIQRVVELTFSGEDVQVIAVSDGEQAIARLTADRPHIVLADIGMPKKSGYDVAAFVKGHPELAHIPVVLLAGAFEPVDEARAKQVGSAGVLVKPFEPQQVISRVRELVQGSPRSTPRHVAPAPVAVLPPAPRVQPSLSPTEPPPAHPLAPPAAPAGEQERPVLTRQTAESGLDDYFDRLDAAFATLGSAQANATRPPVEDPFTDKGVPTVADLLGDTRIGSAAGPMEFGGVAQPLLEPPEAPPTRASLPRDPLGRSMAADPTTSSSHAIADVFRALLAAEQGDEDALRRFQAPPMLTEELVDQVTRRVLERLAPETARTLVADVVSEVAERLVREEIHRVKNRQ